MGDIVIEPLPSLEAARDDWQRLALAAGSPYSTWEWAATWWSVEPRGRLWLHACRTPDEERPWAILPLYVERERPLRVVRLLGNGVAGEQGPVCEPGRRADACAALRRLVRGRRTVLLAERLRGDGPWPAVLGGHLLSAEASPVIELGGRSWEAWLEARSRNFRQQLRRRDRTLRERHGLELRLVDDPGRLDDDFETLCALNALRWGEGATSFAGARRDFHRRFARVALERGWLRLWIAELEGAPAAAWIGYRYGGDDWYYEAGRDPRWEPAGVGSALLMHTIRDAFEAGGGAYRLGRGEAAYKARLADTDPGVQTVIAADRGALTAVRLSVAAVRRGPRSVRRRMYLRYGV
jgi:CelD/BcsL family acetyltransferase involved in cellulose biosynthesis